MFREMLSSIFPIPLRRQPLPPISQRDLDLTEEEPISEIDVEACLAAIRQRAERRSQPRTGPAPELFFLALQQAEKFANECLEFGPGRTHNVKVKRLDRAFTIWARTQRFDAVDEAAFSQALLLILSSQGGHKAARDGSEIYVGCRLIQQVADSLTRPTRPMIEDLRDRPAASG
jgi:hypothetical protein